jgi:ubiquinone/menaquinone biosynthesis C-methylase UbiE
MSLPRWFYDRHPELGNESMPDTMQHQQHASSRVHMLPFDGQEANRQDFQHYLLRQAMRGNFLAPIQQPTMILDVASGTGRWLAEVATHFSQAQAYGVDLLSPADLGISLAFPPNCHFQRCDIVDGLPFPAQHFDFVHQRSLLLSLSIRQWPFIIGELARVTRPGGWVELVEANLILRQQGPETARFLQWITATSQAHGIDITVSTKIENFLHNAGLTNIQSKRISIPLGNWGGRLGSLLAKDFTTAALSLKPLVLTTVQISSDLYTYTVEQVRQECDALNTSCDFYVTTGQCSQ